MSRVYVYQTHIDAKSQFLSQKSILLKSTPTLNLKFPAKNWIIENLIFLTKIGILPQCETGETLLAFLSEMF